MHTLELIAEPFLLREVAPAADTFTVLPTTAAGPFQGWVWPMPVWNGRNPVITNGFDPTPHPKWGMKHAGVDIMYIRLPDEPSKLPDGHKRFFVPSNRIPVFAVGSGIVAQSGKNPLGHHVIIDHGNGYSTFYQHLTSNGLPPKSTRIPAGTPIGFVGHNPFPGGYPLNHLHFEIWPRGKKALAIDPGQVLSGGAVQARPPAAAPARSAAPGPVGEALRLGRWTEAIRLALRSGLREENRLTDLVFQARHPELMGRPVRAGEQGLVREWLGIRDRLVRPILGAPLA